MKVLPKLLLLLAPLTCLAGPSAAVPGWQQALPGHQWEFPRDHFTHNDYRTEWWYATGQVHTSGGAKFGYQFTLFRRGVRPPGDRAPTQSRWVVDHLPLGHFALTDISGQKFFFDQRLERGAFGRAGFARFGETENRLAWVGDWSIALLPDGQFAIKATQQGAALDLILKTTRPPVLNGSNGLSQKSAGTGNASLYYSLPRMETTGTVTVDGQSHAVTGLSWLDREWATNQLGPDQVGWDWFSLHLSDGSDLMLYQLRRADGSADPFSSGTRILPDGTSRHLEKKDFVLTPLPGRTWTSKVTKGTYPTGWRLEIPSESLVLDCKALMENQELALEPVSYWEGAVGVSGSLGNQPVTGEGYLEMTGYSGPLQALKQ